MKIRTDNPVIPIWGENIPGNTGKSKRDVMTVDETLTMRDVFEKYPGIWDKSTRELGDLRGNDYLVWQQEILDGYAEETYTDVPILIPFLVEGSRRCVICAPGGAYLTKSVGGEGEDIARFLNAAGISCFVLWYRSYPYRAPLMYLDCQRAVRYVRHNADRFGIDPDKIATVGFSAGGNLVGVEALVVGNEPVVYPGYVPDEVDAEDGRPNALGLIYAAISMPEDKIVAIIAGKDVYNDLDKCREFSDRYEMVTHVTEEACPAFLCACMDDDVVPPLRNFDLAKAYTDMGISCEVHIFPYGGHGFGGCVYNPVPPGLPFPEPDYSACEQWKELFVSWLNRTLV